MQQAVKVLSLALYLCVIHANSLKDEDFEMLLRDLGIMDDSSNYQVRGTEPECKALHEECSGVTPCCDPAKCYWAEGYDLRRVEECVNCVSQGKLCQRDSQCCVDLQCNKGKMLDVDGMCEESRHAGPCYRDRQCVNNCKKDNWWKTGGTCT